MKKKAIKELKGDFISSSFHLDTIYVENISDPDKFLKIHLKASTDFNGNEKIFLNGYLDRLFKTNPLPSAERLFPLAFDYKFNYNYYLNLLLPDGYEIEYLPESKRIGLEHSTMLFSSLLSTNEAKNDINIQSRFQTNTTVFEPTEYNYMRALIETMLEQQNKNIILKKIK